MARWQPNARGRLQQAALELFSERGFEQTTVAEIAERAGLTERTFFRHFDDKPEVLFDGAAALVDMMVTTVANAPGTASPLEAAAAGLEACGQVLQGRRDFARTRRRILLSNSELQERELIKLASMASAVAGVLRGRGVAGPTAALTAEVALAVFRAAFDRWLDQSDDPGLSEVIRGSFEQLAVLTAPERQVVAGPPKGEAHAAKASRRAS